MLRVNFQQVWTAFGAVRATYNFPPKDDGMGVCPFASLVKVLVCPHPPPPVHIEIIGPGQITIRNVTFRFFLGLFDDLTLDRKFKKGLKVGMDDKNPFQLTSASYRRCC